MSIVTRQRVTLPALLLDADWQGKYNRVQVYRSRVSEAGPFTGLYGPSLLPAVLTSSGVRPTNSVVDKALELLVDNTTVSIVFQTGVTGYASVASAINAASRLVHADVDTEGRLTLSTTSRGKESVLAVLGGDAASLLCLPLVEPASVAFGEDPWPLLTEGNKYVYFEDVNGSTDYFYQFRYYNSTLGLLSSPKQLHPDASPLDPSQLVTGFVRVLTGGGVPVKNREIIIRTLPSTGLLGGALVGGFAGEGRFKTDAKGEFSVPLVRGITIEVFVTGTPIARTLVTPTDPEVTSFNLLSPELGKDDLFNVQIPHLKAATRRSL